MPPSCYGSDRASSSASFGTPAFFGLTRLKSHFFVGVDRNTSAFEKTV